MDVNEHERLSNITLRHKLVRKVMDVNEHEHEKNRLTLHLDTKLSKETGLLLLFCSSQSK